MKIIATLLILAVMVFAVGCSKEETPPPASTAPAVTPPPTEGGTQRQGGLPAPKLNEGAGVNNFGTR